jgi:transcriptional regulator with XRE-family HTH domain
MTTPIKSPKHATLGRTIRTLRTSKGLSQEDLGYRCDLHRNYIGAIERGEINPTFRTLLKLAAGLETTLMEIMTIYERSTDVSPETTTGTSAAPNREHSQTPARTATRCARS